MISYLEKRIDDLYVVWLNTNNRYIILKEPAMEVFRKLAGETDGKDIIKWTTQQYGIDNDEAITFVTEISDHFRELLEDSVQIEDHKADLPVDILSNEGFPIRYYGIRNITLGISFEQEEYDIFFHPLLSHFEINDYCGSPDNNIFIYKCDEKVIIQFDNELLGAWGSKEQFQDHLYLAIMRSIYGLKKEDWMGILHAGAVARNGQSILFPANGGSGKSTLAGLLMSKGFDIVSDDIIPISKKGNLAFQFPGAVSIKKGSLPVMLECYPELADMREYHYPDVNKTVRYLPQETTKMDTGGKYPIKALVTVEYEPDIRFEVEEIANIEFLDFFLSQAVLFPDHKSAGSFLDWYFDVPCYKMKYSNIEDVVPFIEKLLADGS